MASRDPFYSVKDKVVGNLTRLRSDFARFDTLSARSADYSSLSNSLKQQITAIETDCKDLAQTIVIVETNRVRFSSISDAELNSRKSFVSETQATLRGYSDQLKRAQAKVGAESRRDLMQAGQQNSRFSGAVNSQSSREQDDYVSSAKQQQAQLINQQDVVLEDMDAALARLKDISNDINSELIEQDQMLNDVDDSLDTAQGNMDLVLKKMDKLLATSDRGRICCVIGLFFIAVILIIIIIYV